VAVYRPLDHRKHGVVVFRDRATRFRDALARPCTTYRYTIVNIDPSGRRSTGVPTSVMTDGSS
jgi:hypothetical protein